MTRCYRIALPLLLALFICAGAHATAADTQAIRSVLDTQVAAWNRGDIATFMQGYKDSPSTTFVGKTVQHGYATILDRYRKAYSSKDRMGQLTFNDIEVNQLDAHFAVVTGHFHLTRTSSAGGDAGGVFSLIFQKTAGGWKIILDHTS